jgi:hypothetical protein
LTDRFRQSIIFVAGPIPSTVAGVGPASKGKQVLENCHVLARGAARKQGRSSWHQRLALGEVAAWPMFLVAPLTLAKRTIVVLRGRVIFEN